MKMISLIVGCGITAASQTALAQEKSSTPETTPAATATQGQPGAAAADDFGIQRVVVSSQRRAQSLLEVPIGITVLNGEDIKNAKLDTLKDVQLLAPSLQFIDAPQQPSFSIRGVGSKSFDYSVEQSVGVVLDEVAQTLPRAPALNTLADVERIEVLRGPQGTLFGKNTSAGVIAISTRKPQLGELSDGGHIQIGSRGERQVQNIANIPLGSEAAVRLVGAYQTRDNVVQNVASGTIEKPEDRAFTAKVLWNPTSKLSLYGIASYQESKGDPGVFTTRTYGAGTFAPGVGNTFIQTSQQAAGVTASPDNDRVALNSDNFQHSRLVSSQLTANYQLDNAVFTSVTSYRTLDYLSSLEPDSAPLTVYDHNLGSVKGHTFVQEVRLASSGTSNLEYVTGLYYQDQKLASTQDQSGGLGYLPNNAPIRLSTFGGELDSSVASRNIAAFGDATYRTTDRIKLLGGLRLTKDTIGTDLFTAPIPGVCSLSLLVNGICNPQALPSANVHGVVEHTDYSARLGAQYELTKAASSYVTLARGYKGAGVTTVSGKAIEIRPETVLSIEAGLKADFWDKKASFSGAVFNSRFKDFQADMFDPQLGASGGWRTGNAGGLRSRGVELELNATPMRGLTTRAALTYTDAIFTDYKTTCYPGQTVAQGCDQPGPGQDVTGERLNGAPKLTGNLGLTYRKVLPNSMKGVASANWSYRSKVQFLPGDPNTLQGSYGLLNLNLGVSSADNSWTVSVYGRNVLNKRFQAVVFPTFFDVGGYSQVTPSTAFRSFGMALDWRL